MARRRSGYTLIEAIVAIAITAMTAAVILLAVDSSFGTSKIGVDQTIADGIAQQLMDEILGKRYISAAGDPYNWPLGASSWELDGQGRERFNDIDDFNGFATTGAEDTWGQALGTGNGQGAARHPSFQVPAGYFAKWNQKVEVYYVDENDYARRLPDGQTSNVRGVEVTVSRIHPDGLSQVLAKQRRIHAYLPHN